MRTKQKTIHTADVNSSAMLPQQWRGRDKLSVSFEPCHMWWTCSHFLLWQIKKDVGHEEHELQ